MNAKYRFTFVNLNSDALPASGETTADPTFLRTHTYMAGATEFKKIGGTQLGLRVYTFQGAKV